MCELRTVFPHEHLVAALRVPYRNLRVPDLSRAPLLRSLT